MKSMKRQATTLAALLLAAAAAAQEPPPPPIEPELGPGSRLVDPRADELVRQMSDRLATATAFALEAEEVYDEVPEHSPRRQLTSLRHVALRRPDRLAGDAAGDAVNRSFWYDGKTFTALDKEQNVWTSGRRARHDRRGARLGVRPDGHGDPARRLPLRATSTPA